MKNFPALMSAAVAAAVLAGPSLAQIESLDVKTMTCGGLMTLDEAAMTSAINGISAMMQYELMSDADKKAMDDKMATETAGMSEEEKSAHRMKAMETEMQTKMDAMTEEEKAEQTKSNEELVTRLKAACTGNDSMQVMDAMKASM